MSAETTPAPRVCQGCGCQESDACLVQVGYYVTGCWWVDGEEDLCVACAEPARKVRGPRHDHRAAAVAAPAR